jgi:hypothetical protein
MVRLVRAILRMGRGTWDRLQIYHLGTDSPRVARETTTEIRP